MTRRLVILTEIISPYRIPLFNALAQRPEVDLHVIFLAETDPVLRQWRVPKEEIQFSYEVLQSWRKRVAGYNVLVNMGTANALKAATPDVILCGGYSYMASWRAQSWAWLRHIPFFLWSESNSQDMRRSHALVELMKSQYLAHCNGFVVPGQSAREYLRSHKVEDGTIFTAVNAVDNDFYSAAAQVVRQNAAQFRTELALPNRYFLFSGRLVREKGVFELLSAYATLDTSTREDIGLVFAGGGSARSELEDQAGSISNGVVRFVGFGQREQLAAYYALADALVLPTYSDPWGLVVNEGMACGLPVILSRVAGCSADLVTDNWNGLIVEPRDAPSLMSALRALATQPDLCRSMGANSLQRISKYSPSEWSNGVVRMLEEVGATHG
jgi:glycosyltransferase involved in cell wall biosynthesis